LCPDNDILRLALDYLPPFYHFLSQDNDYLSLTLQLIKREYQVG
jgi:hypothetical protein